MYRGQVTAVDAKGVYVLIPALHPSAPFGPLDHVGARPAVGARVLVADCGEPGAPDLVAMTGSGPTSSTDNAIARYDGTGGALQGSGVTIDDGDNVTGVGNLTQERAYPTHVLNGVGGAGGVLWQTSGSNRFDLGMDDSPGDLRVIRRDDSGTYAGEPLRINRATGKITLGDAGTGAGLEFGYSGPRDMAGSGSPEGVVTAPIGSTWRRTNGGAGTTFYVKESGSGNTGWVAK